MTKTRTLYIINIAILVLLAGVVLVRPMVFLSSKPAELVFYSPEMVVSKPIAKPIVRSVPKAVARPQAPVVVPPLPIMPPKIVSKVMPGYPQGALLKGIEGVTVVQAYVGAAGKPEAVKVKFSSGTPELDQAALKAISQWTFAPALQGQAAVASWFEFPIRFVIK